MRKLIDPDHLEISIARQCELLGLARSSWYYQAASETEENLSLLRLIDEEYTRHPLLRVSANGGDDGEGGL